MLQRSLNQGECGPADGWVPAFAGKARNLLNQRQLDHSRFRGNDGCRTKDRKFTSINLGVVGAELGREKAGDLFGFDPLKAQIGVAVQCAEPAAGGVAGGEIVERLV